MGWLSVLMGFVDPLTKITGQIVDWQLKKVQATTDKAKIEADENIAKLQALQAAVIAESAHSNAIPWGRAFLMAPFGIYLWTILVWDKVLGMGTTDNISPTLWQMMLIVWGFYFITDVSKIWKR